MKERSSLLEGLQNKLLRAGKLIVQVTRLEEAGIGRISIATCHVCIHVNAIFELIGARRSFKGQVCLTSSDSYLKDGVRQCTIFWLSSTTTVTRGTNPHLCCQEIRDTGWLALTEYTLYRTTNRPMPRIGAAKQRGYPQRVLMISAERAMGNGDLLML